MMWIRLFLRVLALLILQLFLYLPFPTSLLPSKHRYSIIAIRIFDKHAIVCRLATLGKNDYEKPIITFRAKPVTSCNLFNSLSIPSSSSLLLFLSGGIVVVVVLWLAAAVAYDAVITHYR